MVVYPLSGCPGHQVIVSYTEYGEPARSLRIKGLFGHPPYFVGGDEALGFFWDFTPDPFFPDFKADIEFQYNLADMPPNMTEAKIVEIWGWDANLQMWVPLTQNGGGIHDVANRRFTIFNQQSFYKWYAIGSYKFVPGVPTIGEWTTLILVVMMGIALVLVRRRYLHQEQE